MFTPSSVYNYLTATGYVPVVNIPSNLPSPSNLSKYPNIQSYYEPLPEGWEIPTYIKEYMNEKPDYTIPPYTKDGDFSPIPYTKYPDDYKPPKPTYPKYPDEYKPNDYTPKPPPSKFPPLPKLLAPGDKLYMDKPSKKLTEFKVIFYFKSTDTKREIEAYTFKMALERTWFDRGSNVIPKKVKVIRIGEVMPKK
jgi:hypothetical protein